MITEDKAFRCLNQWKSKVEDGKAWVAPVSLFVPLALALGATTFKDAYGLGKETWQAIFVIGVAAAAIWTLAGLSAAFKSRGNRTVEALLDELKKGADVQRSQLEHMLPGHQPSSNDAESAHG